MNKLIIRKDLQSRHYTYDSAELVIARETMGLSQREFAELCGWSQSYQSNLECPEGIRISKHVAFMLRYILQDTIQVIIVS